MNSKQQALASNSEAYDVLVIGAGVSGMYALHHFRDDMGLSVCVFDGAEDIGGTWWYNRYPGARVDGPGSPFYGYTFSEELFRDFDWKETQSEWSEVLAYLNFVADRLDLRRDIRFNTWVTSAHYDEQSQRWTVETDTGVRASAKFLICASGALSTTNMPDITGINDFSGECYHTARWPHQPVSFKGKRVAVLGTGSSGIQSIPEIAKEADEVIVLQRTPQFAFPANNRPLTPEEVAEARATWENLREKMFENMGGFPVEPNPDRSAMDDTAEQREALYESLWQKGGFGFFMKLYNDIASSEASNATLADFVRGKIREIVKDTHTADRLMPDYFVITKRPILEDGYFQCFNRENVTLVDLREEPIEHFTATSVVTNARELPIDMLVLATGFDAISGTLLKLNPTGRDGLQLQDRWQDRFHNYLGMMINGFPNLFMIHGPGSPGVFYNMPLGAERQLDWIGECMRYMQNNDLGTVEPGIDSEAAWSAEVDAIADATLFPRTKSWWTGANIPGKPSYFTAYLGGNIYYMRIAGVAEEDYSGCVFKPAKQAVT